MAKLRVAAAGAGYFSQFQYLGWRNLAEVEMVGLSNRDRAKGEAMAARYDVPRVFGEFEEMLDATRPEARSCANSSFIFSNAGLMNPDGISSVPISSRNSFAKITSMTH